MTNIEPLGQVAYRRLVDFPATLTLKLKPAADTARSAAGFFFVPVN
jgi:hypothetical protein